MWLLHLSYCDWLELFSRKYSTMCYLVIQTSSIQSITESVTEPCCSALITTQFHSHDHSWWNWEPDWYVIGVKIISTVRVFVLPAIKEYTYLLLSTCLCAHHCHHQPLAASPTSCTYKTYTWTSTETVMLFTEASMRLLSMTKRTGTIS